MTSQIFYFQAPPQQNPIVAPLAAPLDFDSTPTLFTHVVASVDKTLYDDYLCLGVLKKQQIKWQMKLYNVYAYGLW